MTWEQKSRWFIRSDKGYNVCKAMVGETPMYTAWTPRKKELLCTPNLEEAKQACEEHYSKRKPEAA